MSNADDRPPCAECGDTWGAGVHDYAHPYRDPREPAPQPAPSDHRPQLPGPVAEGHDCAVVATSGYRCQDSCPSAIKHPAPSGDEAKVREAPDGIADRWLQLHTMMPPTFSDLCQRPECDHARHLHAPSCGHVNHNGAKNCACSGFVGSAMSVADALLGAVREAYAAGKADGARTISCSADCALELREEHALGLCNNCGREIAARHGSEGK